MLRFSALASLAVLAVSAACAPVARDPACIAADACDQALELPTEDFAANNPQFGDDLNNDGVAGVDLTDSGTCWQNAETAAVCAKTCQDFLAAELANAQEDNNVAVIEACGGDVSEE